MKTKNLIYPLIVLGMLLTTISGCKKKKKDDSSSTPAASLPVVSTAAVSSIGITSATSGGDVSSDGGDAVTEKGVCWSTSANPTTSNSRTSNGTGTGSFASSLTGLAANTTYYVRAYATNSAGTAYGSQVTFASLPAGVNSLSATVDGSPFVASTFTVLASSGKVAISGTSGTKSIRLIFPDPFTTGVHSLDILTYIGQYSPTTSTAFSSTSGTVDISEYNASTGKIKGTFNFIASDFSASPTITVTAGQFEVYK